MQALQEKYTDKDVVWLTICSSAPGKQGHREPAEITEQMNDWNAHNTAYLIDESGEVGKMYGAKTTPHMYVINPNGKLIYAGAIDSIPSADQDDIAEATNYVEQALNAAMNGKEVPNKVTKPYGCSVKY
jgi:glutathione peroxidase-family protein